MESEVSICLFNSSPSSFSTDLTHFNASDASATESDTAGMEEGDAVLFDLWAPINNYWCDMTRTVFYKSCSEEHRKVYEIVKAAQQAAIDFVITLRATDRKSVV